MRISFVSTINGKFDEGMRNISTSLFRTLSDMGHETLSFTAKTAILPWNLHKIKQSDIVYFGYRAVKKTHFLMKLCSSKKNKLFLLVCQKPDSAFIDLVSEKEVVDSVLYLKDEDVESLPQSIKRIRFFLPIDQNKFAPVSLQEKASLKEELYNTDKAVVLHVGHLNEGRGVSVLKQVDEDKAKVLVCDAISDSALHQSLVSSNVKVFSDYLNDIEHYYQASDVFLFPTKTSEKVISVPFSCLEAAACGLPILIDAKFDGLDLLKNYISEEGIFAYDDDSFNKKLNAAIDFAKTNARSLLKLSSTWENVAGEIINEGGKAYEKD